MRFSVTHEAGPDFGEATFWRNAFKNDTFECYRNGPSDPDLSGKAHHKPGGQSDDGIRTQYLS